jgi:hypothetical protein
MSKKNINTPEDTNFLDELDELDRTVVSVEDTSGELEEDEELRTVRMEGFTSSDLEGGGFDYSSMTPSSNQGADGVNYDQFAVNEGHYSGSSYDQHPSAWAGPAAQGQPQAFGPASGAFPQAGSAFGGSGEFQQASQNGYVLVEGADSPSMTVRHEAPGFSGGRDVEMATYSGPADISRGSATSSPVMRVVWVAGVILAVGLGFFLLREYAPVNPKPIVPKVVYVMLALQTNPSGAQVYVNGEKQAQVTPTTIQARIGDRVNIQIQKDKYKTLDFSWTARGNQEKTLTLLAKDPPKPRPDPRVLSLNAKLPAPGRPAARKRRRRPRVRRRRGPAPVPAGHVALYVKTEPPGAKVRVQGRLQHGRTPLRVVIQQGLEAKITVQKYGHHDAYFIWKANSNLRKTIRLYRHSWYNP